MAIIGIETVTFGVADLAECARFFEDFGLQIASSTESETQFVLPEGSRVVLRMQDDPRLPRAYFDGPGVRETIWGVDSLESLDELAANLEKDREITRDPDGTIHFVADGGIPMGLRIFKKRTAVCAPDSINAPGNIQRFNQLRRWRTRAHPRGINHVVYSVIDYRETFEFLRDRLKFRLSDHSRNLGAFCRADGAHEHHNIFVMRCNALNPKGQPGFGHICFSVEDIDEIMAGANHMERRGWKGSTGLGRHRIGSALFYYITCPAGGEAEYGADTDYLDDSWVPREWDPVFGNVMWIHNLPPFMKVAPRWDMSFTVTDLAPVPRG